MPLTAAISDGILVTVSDQPFLIPIDAIRDLAEPEPAAGRYTGGEERKTRLQRCQAARLLQVEGQQQAHEAVAEGAQAPGRENAGDLR